MALSAKPKPVRVTEEQVALVLAAVTDVEGWCTEKESIAHDPREGWKYRRVTGHNAAPQPSAKLLTALRKLRALERAKT